MKVLILGSGSFAGQVLYSNLLLQGVEVLGINRSDPKNEYCWPWIKGLENKLHWHTLNINHDCNEIINLTKKFKPNMILDFMGQGMVAPSWEDPQLWYHVNLSMKTKFLQSLLDLDSLEKYIRASTPEVYGSSKNFIKEDGAFNPSTPYAVSHSAIDYHIRCLGQKDKFPYLIGRFANFYGVGQQLYRVIPRLFLSCLTGRSFTLDGGGKSTRFFINSIDIFTAFEKMMKTSIKCDEFNFSGNEEITINNLVRLICELTSTEFDEIVTFGPERMGKDMCYRLNCGKSKLELNWQTKTTLKEGVMNVVNWIKRNQNFLAKESWDYIHLL